ncbi:hypothetical protein [Flavilitoribacter nigricans]|uniref:Uncharacterized protein n=1 Tax=Flavilitoribacter nigricans (strain ATCC 23147 / DSM 23189 / NBRC 102662 / NCIMB 1420 / SS-2) TaxID=1122177 RepID=A0A2D0NGU6_FLAN2|nr:hypothetical protein [Flavilitoribacter nigricans]PHN07638.1 hypothetical protein CRP01_05940 [Flavilitoribacter nigricans DSM 23189 = NBRC 102662]
MNDLSAIIQFYEEEIAQLEAMIAQRVANGEFDLAHHHHQALLTAKDKLANFRQLQDPNYRRNQLLSELNKYHERSREKRKQEIDREWPESGAEFLDDPLFGDLLADLFEQRIPGFTILLSEYQDSPQLRFESPDTTVKIRVYAPDDERYQGKPTWYQEKCSGLKRFNFIQDGVYYLFEKRIEHPGQDLLELSRMLSAIFFECFDFLLVEKSAKVIVE